MLYAIFFLLVIALFPLLWFILGLLKINITYGGLAFFSIFVFYFLPSIIALIRKHRNENAIAILNLFLGWTFIGWIIALVWSFTADVKTSGQDKLTDVKPPEGIIDAVKGSNNKDARISFSGEPELSNDSYVLYLAKKFNIHKNNVLGKHVLNERLYDTIDDALSAGDELNNLEIKVEKSRAEQRARDYEQAALKAAQADKEIKVKLFYWAKITLIFILAIPLLWAVFFQASKYFGSKSLIALAASQAIEDAKPHKDLYTREIKGLLKTKDGWGCIGDVSEYTGDFRPYFFPTNSPVGKKILAACSDGDYCKLIGSMNFIDLPKVVNAMNIGENSGSFEIIAVKSVSK